MVNRLVNMTNSLAKESTSSRLISVDAYRGFVMLLITTEQS